MFKYLKVAFFAVLFTLLVNSCGQRHKAEGVIEEFLKENLETSKYSLNVLKVDSTHFLSDSILSVMKENARKSEFFKENINYAQKTPSRKYFYARTKMYIQKDTLRLTFYLDSEIKGVLAFKED
ncbi:MAG: hypothetical protein LUC37_04525 [Prevotella sp.]|nr:hypothetical protein [Prevotella sp.]